MSLDEVIEGMAEHARSHPTHGFNCACKDGFTREAHQLLRDPAKLAEFRLLAQRIK